MRIWETDFYPVRVLGAIVLPLWGLLQTPAQYWIKIVHPWVQEFYPVLGLGSGEELLRHFQTPVLYWTNFSLRDFLLVIGCVVAQTFFSRGVSAISDI